MGKINIFTQNKRFPVAPNLYGLFFEDINRAADGGLYPELLRNRSFEDSLVPKECSCDKEGYSVITPSGWKDEFNHGEGLSRWITYNSIPYTPIPAWYSINAKMELDTGDTLNKNRSAALSVKFDKGGKIYNIGYSGIPQRAKLMYCFYMFAKVNRPQRLVISLEDDKRILAHTDFLLSKEGYIRYDRILTASEDSVDARLVITCPEGGCIKFGFISLMPRDTFLGHGLRIDLVEKLRDLNPGFLRFPGGCVVEGITSSTAMRFRNMVGPVWERPSHLLMWHYHTYNGLGFHEFLQLCEDLNMEPLYVLNCGMTCQARCPVLMEGDALEEMIQDALDALEYATGPENSKWGMLRSQMGHPAPFKINYVEIGNENSGTDYESRYLECYRRIKQKYPHIACIANAHVEDSGLPADMVDEHFYNTAEYFAENIHYYDSYDRGKPDIFLGELAVVRGYAGQLYGALGEAAFLIGAERNQDIVHMASYAPLFENVDYFTWFPNLIRFNNMESYAIPSYYAWKMFGMYRGDYVVESREESDILYRPVKGMASLLGQADICFKNATWNGNPAEITHELMGRVKREGKICRITAPDEEQQKEAEKLYQVDPDRIFVILGQEDEQQGCFEIEILAEEGKAVEIGLFSSRMPKEVYVSDETDPPNEWNAGNVRPFLWKIENGRSTITEFSYPNGRKLAEDADVELSAGKYNHFKYETDGKRIGLYLNGRLIQEAYVPSFQSFVSVVSDTETKILIKAVNLSEKEEPIEIVLDCDVKQEYFAAVLTGEKQAVNSFENPQNICDREVCRQGASKKFTYYAPPLSANVIRLIKK